ncbi:MAG: glucosaminidase domain-containing protein [Niabella sp.]
MNRRTFLAFLFSSFLLFAKAQNAEIIKHYIKTYCGIAVEEMQRTGVPAAVKLAQGIHETMAGQSDLVQQSNNHFGIKCKEGYGGPYVLHDDDRPQERFMKYDNAEQSYKDHSDFLKNRNRYAALFQLDPTDYAGWAYGLKKAGYATNPKYPQIIIGLIEKYDLEAYTLMGLGKLDFNEDVKAFFAKATPRPAAPATPENHYPEGDFLINNTRVIYVKAGTDLNNIAQQYNMPLARLYDMNDFSNPAGVLNKGGLVYLQLKRTVGSNLYHEVKKGETIFDIAQAEGIRLESLLKYNHLSKFASPAIGSKLKLTDETLVAQN